MDDHIDLQIAEILAEMDTLGRALFDAAHHKAINKKLVTKLQELGPPAPDTAKDPAGG